MHRQKAHTTSKGAIRMIKLAIALWIAAGTLLVAAPAYAQSDSNQGQGQAVVTVLPKHDGDPLPPSVLNQDFSVKLDGKPAKVTTWTPFKSQDSVELVLLIDGSARNSLGGQMEYLAHFLNSLPPNTKAAVAYMENGRAAFAGPLASDHAHVSKQLHLPGGSTGSDASPYFCLSDLAKHWPSQDSTARREVLMVTDGVDNYQRQFDPDDPYVQAAIADSVRARLVVYSIYWKDQGRADSSAYSDNTGQSLAREVTEATGGKSFWEGTGNPVSFEPYLDDLTRRLRNQYELGFTGHVGGKAEVESLKLKLSAPGTEIDAPQQVLVAPSAPAQK
jgi:hypothetical protein